MNMAMELPQLVPGQTMLGYKIDKKLGEGGFGGVYLVSNNNGRYALKVEGSNEQIQLLKMEVAVLEALVTAKCNRHFANIFDKGRNEKFNYIVMTLMGKSLQDLKKEGSFNIFTIIMDEFLSICVFLGPNGHFSVSTVLRVGIYCLEGLEDLHIIGYLHRDVKPGNFASGRKEDGEERKIYVLDFGMARKYINASGNIRTPRSAAGFRGTVRYAPISCHLQRELCRKDDLETWLYMIIELTNGRLPWADIQDMQQVGQMKQKVLN